MPRLVLFLSLLLVPLWAAAIGITRAQPDDDAGVLALLENESCALACQLGVSPGRTPPLEAVEILERHPWIGALNANDFIIGWSWSGAQPDLIDGARSGWIDIDRTRSVVGDINIPMRLSAGQAWLALGKPASGGLIDAPPRHEAYYAGFAVITRVDCPVNLSTFWHTPVQLTLAAAPDTTPTPYQTPRWNRCDAP